MFIYREREREMEMRDALEQTQIHIIHSYTRISLGKVNVKQTCYRIRCSVGRCVKV